MNRFSLELLVADCQAFLNVSKALAKSLFKVNKIPVGLGAPGARFAFTFGGFTEGFPTYWRYLNQVFVTIYRRIENIPGGAGFPDGFPYQMNL